MIVFVPAFACVLLMVYHSLAVRGRAVTLRFFIGCFFLFIMKGLTEALGAGNEPDYIPNMKFLEIGGVNYGVYIILLPIGWTFAHYCALCLAEAFHKGNLSESPSFWRLVSLCMTVLGFVGVCMEGASRSAGWWRWQQIHVESAGQYFFVWAFWGSAFYPFFFLPNLKVSFGAKPLWVASIVYLFIYLLIFSLFGSGMMPLCLIPLLLGLRNWGPRLAGLRRSAAFRAGGNGTPAKN